MQLFTGRILIADVSRIELVPKEISVALGSVPTDRVVQIVQSGRKNQTPNLFWERHLPYVENENLLACFSRYYRLSASRRSDASGAETFQTCMGVQDS